MVEPEPAVLWQKQARELGGDGLVEVIEGMASDLTKVKSRLDVMDKHIMRAFPEGDVDGHRIYHELIIQRTREIKSLKLAIMEKTIVGLVYAAVIFLGLCILEGLKQKIKGWL